MIVERAKEDRLKSLVRRFANLEGRQPRAMLSSGLKLTDHSWINEIAVFLAGLGFNVDIAPRFKGTRELGATALENDVDVLILSQIDGLSQSGITEELEKLFLKNDSADILLLAEPSAMTKAQISSRLQNWLSELFLE